MQQAGTKDGQGQKMPRANVYLVLFLLVMVLAATVYVCSETMRVREVVVLGCVEQDPARVAELAQITNEESVFQLKFKEIAQRVSADPYFETESVRYLFPDRVRITVKERLASALLVYNGSVYVLDDEGYVLEKNNEVGDRALPLAAGLELRYEPVVGMLLGTEPENAEAEQTLTEEEEEIEVSVQETETRRVAALSAVLKQLQAQNLMQLIETIDLTQVSDLKMTTVSGFTVALGNFDEMESKIRWLAAVEPVLVSEGYKGGTITVSTGDNASFLPETEEAEEDDPEKETAE